MKINEGNFEIRIYYKDMYADYEKISRADIKHLIDILKNEVELIEDLIHSK